MTCIGTLAQSGRLAIPDLLVIAGYFVFVAIVGVLASRKRETSSDFFLASRRVPVLAAAVSVIATSLSAVTFIGGPADSFAGNLTYLSLNLGAILGALVVALFFIPAFYRAQVTSIYELLGQRFGTPTQRGASAMFLVGRMLANGVRLFLAAMPVSLLVFGDTTDHHLLLSVGIVTLVATAYTVAGGIRAVIWTDCAQVLILVVAISASAIVLLNAIPLSTGEIVDLLRESKAADGSSKLTLLDTRTDPALPFTIWSALIGFTLFNVAAYGTDHDLVQRTLTCKSAFKGSASLMLAIVLGAMVSSCFLIVGLLLFAYHQSAGVPAPEKASDVFLEFLLRDMPAGLRGLALAGLFAAAMASLDSALNAMSASFVRDLVKPARPSMSERNATRLARVGVVLAAVAVAGFACLCVPLQRTSGEGVLPFALGVMMYAYTGLLAVYVTGLFTKRGSNASCFAAFGVGVVSVAALQFGPAFLEARGLAHDLPRFSLGWRMAIGFALALGVCLLGKAPARDA